MDNRSLLLTLSLLITSAHPAQADNSGSKLISETDKGVSADESENRPFPFSDADIKIAVRDGIDVSCVGHPTDAVVKLPAPIAQWMRVVCDEHGHVIYPSFDYLWMHKRAWEQERIGTALVYTDWPARRKATLVERHERWFTDIRPVILRDYSFTQRIYKQIWKEVLPPQTLVTLATTNRGKELFLIFYLNHGAPIRLIVMERPTSRQEQDMIRVDSIEVLHSRELHPSKGGRR